MTWCVQIYSKIYTPDARDEFEKEYHRQRNLYFFATLSDVALLEEKKKIKMIILVESAS